MTEVDTCFVAAVMFSIDRAKNLCALDLLGDRIKAEVDSGRVNPEERKILVRYWKARKVVIVKTKEERNARIAKETSRKQAGRGVISKQSSWEKPGD